jgi:hypothetical protein
MFDGCCRDHAVRGVQWRSSQLAKAVLRPPPISDRMSYRQDTVTKPG